VAQLYLQAAGTHFSCLLRHRKCTAYPDMIHVTSRSNNTVYSTVCAVRTAIQSLCLSCAPRHEGVLGEWRYSATHSLISALDGGEWSASRPGRFTPKERHIGTHWIGGWVGSRAVLDAVVKRKNSNTVLI
jgi:hypothetical protein